MEQLESSLAASNNPFALVVQIAKAALKKGKGMSDQELLELKREILQQMRSKKIVEVKIRQIMNFLRYYVRFEKMEMNDNFDKEIAVNTQNRDSMGLEEFLLDRAKKEGIETGIQKGEENLRRRIVRSQLLKRQYSPEQIAEIFEVPVALVLSIREEMEREDT